MPDIVTPAVRSRMMSGIRASDTKPELILRRGLYALGRRFRLGHRYRWRGRLLPGRPDLVFPGARAVILAHGCFWHGHDCALFRWPATRAAFWRDKIAGNIARDRRVRAELLALGWRVLEVRECMLKGRTRLPAEELLARCIAFLDGDEQLASIGTDATVAVATDVAGDAADTGSDAVTDASTDAGPD